MHKPIFLKNISLSFAQKSCFEDFSVHIYAGSRIAIIGRNGSGKSSLLDILRQQLLPSAGELVVPQGICFGYVEQTINDFHHLSGGERFNKRLSQILATDPDVLLLDEPTNHLDKDNRKSLLQMLKRYQGTLMIVTHDTELLYSCVDTLWHIHDNKIVEFVGSYDDYMREIGKNLDSIDKQIASLKAQGKDNHNALMQEQQRAKKSKAYGAKKYDGDKLARKAAKAQGQMTSNKNQKFLDDQKVYFQEQLSKLYIPKPILPTFSLKAENISSNNLLSITSADIGYVQDRPILQNIHLTLGGKERIAIAGKNGSGKSTLLKAILEQNTLFKTGSWHLPRSEYINYLDQHYANLKPELSVIDHVKASRTDWSEVDARHHLSDFLFRRTEEVTQFAAYLSGGEKVRLALSLLAAKTPRLLIVDEITNNLDLETKAYVVDVLEKYPGAMIVVSHEEDFLIKIGIDYTYTVIDGKLSTC